MHTTSREYGTWGIFMIRKPDFILVDDVGKELQEKDAHLLDLTVNDGDIHQFAAGHIPPHWHKDLEAFVLLQGTVKICIGDTVYQLCKGDGCFINSEVLHSFTADTSGPCRYRSFVFNPDIIGGTPGSVFDTVYVRPLLENGAAFLKFQRENGDNVFFEQFEQAFIACSSEEYGYEFQLRNALSNVLLYAKSKSTSAVKRPIPPIQETRLKEMLLWIDRHIEAGITVSEIAGTVNICTRECQRIFHQYLFYSPMEYVRRKRIYNAARLLSDTDMPVTDISLSCGFSSPSYFSKQFRELMKSTPSEYRAIARKLP